MNGYLIAVFVRVESPFRQKSWSPVLDHKLLQIFLAVALPIATLEGKKKY